VNQLFEALKHHGILSKNKPVVRDIAGRLQEEQITSWKASKEVRLKVARGVQDANLIDAWFTERTVKYDVILQDGAAQAAGEFWAGMAHSVVVCQVLDALLNLPNSAIRLKLAVTSEVGPNLIEIGQTL
jgi:hypothetical protein